MIQQLQADFVTVRDLYFRRWDWAGRWRLKICSLPGNGRCDDERRLILIDPKSYDREENLVVIIHEICHAVAMCKAVATENGLNAVEFRRRFPRARKVYEAARG
jgi:hypothetical protein